MPSVWEWIVGICASLIVVITAAGLIRSKVVRPMRSLVRRAGRMIDAFLGDKEKKVPSVPERLASLEGEVGALKVEMSQHTAVWHTPASANGPRPGLAASPPDR